MTTNRIRSFFSFGTWPGQLVYWSDSFLTGLCCFTGYRLLLLVQEIPQLRYLPPGDAIVRIPQAFLSGLRFDALVCSHLLAFPLVLLTLDMLLGRPSKILYRGLGLLLSMVFAGSFFICAADLPYFHHFHTRVSTAILVSAGNEDSDLLGGMVFREWRYSWALLPFGLFSWIFIRRQQSWVKRLEQNAAPVHRSPLKLSAAYLLAILAAWGRLPFQPALQARDAYVSDYGLTNMLGLNPVFTFLSSLPDEWEPSRKLIRLLPDETAVRNCQSHLGLLRDPAPFESPFARMVHTDAPSFATPPNVVLVVMESMSAQKMGRYGNPYALTPFLDSLASTGLAFDSVFSTGIHTFAGLYSTLYGLPVIGRQHPMEKVDEMAGWPDILQTMGYRTAYFTTHDAAFDNIGPFLSANGFDRIYAKPDYPPDRIVGPMGVSDDFLFEFAGNVMDTMARTGQPFFVTLMTGSDHGPYIIPDYFKPRHSQKTLGVVEYVDWSVRKLMERSARQPWFDNTLFVFVADHGAAIDKRYDLPLSMVHIPLFFYSPSRIEKPRSVPCVGSQLDVFPTAMGLLGLPYVNNTFGIDLLRAVRPFACTYADDKYAAYDSDFVLVARENGIHSLYHYPSRQVLDHKQHLQARYLEMKTFAESTFQAAQWLRISGLSGMQTAP
jgi:phosphoglycerol transferase MdoB-like AlkP superfamily enzyme